MVSICTLLHLPLLELGQFPRNHFLVDVLQQLFWSDEIPITLPFVYTPVLELRRQEYCV
jgi:hypothetical protein